MNCSTSRILIILNAADELLQRIIDWAQDPHGHPTAPNNVQVALRNAVSVCSRGKLPDSCRALGTVAIGRLAEEFRGYSLREPGKIRLENGAPGPRFWAAVAEFARTRYAADKPVFKKPEPVQTLLKQGVTHTQIALQIYGRRGAGPFVRKNGDIDFALIDQEAREPGSVVPANWVPPWHAELEQRCKQTLYDQLILFARMESGKKNEATTTVEDLLREGTFVQQIERIKGATREEVLAAALRIGVPAFDRPGFRTGESPGEETDQRTLRDQALRLYQKSDGQRGAADIAFEMRQWGYEVTTRAVAATIAHWKKRRRATRSRKSRVP